MKRTTIEVHEEDHVWLKNHRGSGNIKDLVKKIISTYKEVEHVPKSPRTPL